MKICKNLDPKNEIISLNDWLSKCPPQGGKRHWVDGRSSKDTALYWLQGTPKEFTDILKKFNLTFELCSPELVTKIDRYQGNSRNHDLLILAKNSNSERVVISIESKVDESFGNTIGSKLRVIEKLKQKGTPTNVDKRIEILKRAIFPNVYQDIFESIRYQLLTAIAGTLSEAKKQEAKKAIFIVQNLPTSAVPSKKHLNNQLDFDYFIKVLTNGNHHSISDNELLGPFLFTGNDFIPNNIELWIGKYSVDISTPIK